MVREYYILYLITKSYIYQAIGQISTKYSSNTYEDAGLLELENSNYNPKSSSKEKTSILKDAVEPYTRQLEKNINKPKPKKRFNCIAKGYTSNFTK